MREVRANVGTTRVVLLPSAIQVYSRAVVAEVGIVESGSVRVGMVWDGEVSPTNQCLWSARPLSALRSVVL